jgi:peptidoglycan L-alanyl-D-glutamate endopeptidase CwlK
LIVINHSQLAEFLRGTLLDNKPLPESLVLDVLHMTRNGVIKEGGPLASKAQPNWRADALLDGFTPFTVAAPVNQVSEQRQTVAVSSGFSFGAASLKELDGVNANLVRVTRLALSYCSQDFCVYDGIRTYKEQQQHVRDGTSKTMASKHLEGLAVDLVPWVNGQPKWDWNLIWPIAFAMDRAATELGLADRITWGGAWDRKLSDFGGDSAAYKKVVDDYVVRHPGKDFIDGPHFEIRA